MILHGKLTSQVVDRGVSRPFIKEFVVTDGAVPLAMIRKRAADFEGGTRAPVLLVHGFGQNRYAWHLPSRSLANHLATLGYDVFNLDLRGHGRSRLLGGKRCRSVVEYVTEDLPAAIDEVFAQSGKRQVFVVGHSLGGMITYAAAADLEGALAGVATVGSPYNFTRGSFSLSCVSVLFQLLGAAGVSVGNPALAIGHVGRFLNSVRAFAETPLYPIPWRGWHKGAVEIHVLEEHLRLAFDHAGLAEVVEMFEWGAHGCIGGSERNSLSRFDAVDVPLLVIAGSHDDLAPPASVRPGYDRSRARAKTYRALPLGHIDLLVGRDAPRMTWPLLGEWLHRHSS